MKSFMKVLYYIFVKEYVDTLSFRISSGRNSTDVRWP